MKKKNLVLLAALLCSIAIYSFISKDNSSMKYSPASPSDSIPDNQSNAPQKFILGVMNSENDVVNNYAKLNFLKFNTWHTYTDSREITTNLHQPMTTLVTDDYLDNMNTQHVDALTQKMDAISGSSDMFLLMQRPKIEWLIYGQRSDYQCERIDYAENNPATDNWFYTFQDKLTGHDVNDTKDGQPIRSVYCRTVNSNISNSEAIDNPGYVVKRLRTNTEQCRIVKPGNEWQGDQESKWLIKPSIKVDAAWVYANPNEKVCKIKVIGDDLNTILEKDILGENFYDADNGIIYSQGQYIEEFTRGLNLTTPTGSWASRDRRADFKARLNKDAAFENNPVHDLCHADIQVFWYGNCDMWIDYVRVDNEVAHRLLKSTGDFEYNTWLRQEAVDIMSHQTNGKTHVIAAYNELIEYNNIPCIEYVNKKLKSLTGDKISFMCDITAQYGMHLNGDKLDRVMNAGHMYRNLVQRCGFTRFFTESYPFTGQYNANVNDSYARIPSTLNTSPNHYILAKPENPDVYDQWLQENLEDPYWFDPGQSETFEDSHFRADPLPQDAGNFRFWMKTAREISRLGNVPFIYMPQVHQWYKPGEVRREPTNEEQDLLANLGVSYGAKGFIYFWYPSYEKPPSPDYPDGEYGFGIQDKYPNEHNLREHNVYGQAYPKWQKVKDINERMLKWEPYLMSFKNSDIKTYMYQKEYVPNGPGQGRIEKFFDNIETYKPVISNSEVLIRETNPELLTQRFLQVTFFTPIGVSNNDPKYFMITNKRCSPYKPDLNSVGGKRFVRVKLDRFENSQIGMTQYQNFTITDIATNEIKGVFYKDCINPYDYGEQEVDLGWFEPGEGKIFKVAPLLMTGGTMKGKEYKVNPINITCSGIVYNNGHDFGLPMGSKIKFTTNAGLDFTGGYFIGIGDDNGANMVELSGVNNSTWKGIKLANPTYALFSKVKIENVAAKYMVSVSNCPVVAMTDCILNGMAGHGSGGIQINNSTSFGFTPGVEIDNSYFNTYSNDFPAMKIMAFAGEQSSIILRYNHINNLLNPGGGVGMLLNNTGGEVKQNYIYNFGQGISSSSSSIDLFANTISTSLNYVEGIAGTPTSLFGAANTIFNLSPAFTSYLGGNNNLSVKQGNCIWLDASYFNMAKGGNYLNIVQSDWRHLYGYFPFISDSRENATGNCFRINGRDPNTEADIKKYVIYADASPVDFDLLNFNCTPFDYDNFYVIEGGISNDTIWTDGSGNGGGQSTISNNEDFSFKTIYDSMNINMRKKQYELVQNKCKMLLEQYSDSGKTIDAVGKLYFATIAKDSLGNKVDPLKSYYEAYIQSHSGNSKLVQRVFYFIQKCKVRLNQYASAMQGFQTIMTQFPTTYEGLVAKWDYTATHLLDSISGSGGGELEVNFDNMSIEQLHKRLVNLVDDPNDKYDKKKFTKEDRKIIVQNIVNSFETEKSKEVQKVKTLEQKVMNNEATKMEKSDYKSKTLLKTVVKIEVAQTMDEHIDIVQSDLEKVFSLKEGHSATTDDIPVIAYDYKLNQNYPNPFNPTTKINYQIKTPGFVSLKVYDLLGRTVAELVNERMEAGAYAIDFNASKYMLSSGIYFYQMRAGEFVDTKRMVLVK